MLAALRGTPLTHLRRGIEGHRDERKLDRLPIRRQHVGVFPLTLGALKLEYVVGHAQRANVTVDNLGNRVGDIGSARETDAAQALAVLDPDAARNDRAQHAAETVGAMAVEQARASVKATEADRARVHRQLFDIVLAVQPVEAQACRPDRPDDLDRIVFLLIRRRPDIGRAKHRGSIDGARFQRGCGIGHQLFPCAGAVSPPAAWLAVKGSPL